jgi:hypothetical protein
VESLTVKPEEADIIITTIHQSKGAEWNNVLLYDDWTGGIGNNEEKNLLYVATTRAKERLYTGGFWPVYRHAVNLTQEQLEGLLIKVAATGPDDDSLVVPDMYPTFLVTKETFVGSKGEAGVTEVRMNHSMVSHNWAHIPQDQIAGVRIQGIDMVHRGIYVPSHTSLLLDESFFELSRTALDEKYGVESERALAHIAMDALDALRASEIPETIERLALAVVVYKMMVRDVSGKVAQFVEASKLENSEVARTALCAAMLDLINHRHYGLEGRTPSAEYLVGAKDKSVVGSTEDSLSDEEVSIEFKKALGKELAANDRALF